MISPATLRASFHERIVTDSDLGFHPHDLERVKDDRYLLRVLNHTDHDLTRATDMLLEIFTWRKSIDANEINETNIRIDYVKYGVIFPYGRDFDGCLLLIIKCKKHMKELIEFDEIKRIVIYWFDRIEREENGKKITLFLDLENCNYDNMDMDLINFLILLFKSYYPFFLNFIIIYQMPWVMSAAFNFTKSLLPAQGVHKVKFVNRQALRDFVAPEQALKCWGGLDNYVFDFVPENITETAPKKIPFPELGNYLQNSTGELLQFTPNETIYFKIDSEQYSGKLTITNMNETPVSFKIRTIAPEKYQVRPSSGILASGASITVLINTQRGFNMRTIAKDRILIQAVPIAKPDMPRKELTEVWKATADREVDEYRLNCYFYELSKPNNPDMEEECDKVKSVTDILRAVEEKQKLFKVANTEKLQIYLGIFTAIAVIIGMIFNYYLKNCERSCGAF